MKNGEDAESLKLFKEQIRKAMEAENKKELQLLKNRQLARLKQKKDNKPPASPKKCV